MATVTRPSTSLPVPGDYMLSAQVTDWITNIIAFIEAENIDASNTDTTSSDGLVAINITQIITGYKTFTTILPAGGGRRYPISIAANPASGTVAEGDSIGISFYVFTTTQFLGGTFDLVLEDITNAHEYSYFNFATLQDGVVTDIMRVGTKDYGLNVLVGAVKFLGTWEDPLYLGDLALWYSSDTNALRGYVGTPTADTDGYAFAAM